MCSDSRRSERSSCGDHWVSEILARVVSVITHLLAHECLPSVHLLSPVDRKMVINGLNSGANVYMADFEGV